jgi:hypothetical protein
MGEGRVGRDDSRANLVRIRRLSERSWIAGEAPRPARASRFDNAQRTMYGEGKGTELENTFVGEPLVISHKNDVRSGNKAGKGARYDEKK